MYQSLKKRSEACFKRDCSESEEANMSDTSEYDSTESLGEYGKTKSKVDWIQCIMSWKWLHENCTLYGNFCKKCKRTTLLYLKKLRSIFNLDFLFYFYLEFVLLHFQVNITFSTKDHCAILMKLTQYKLSMH